MKGSCIPIEALGRVAALPAGHPERAHLDDCARCRSLLAMLTEFETPARAPEGARFADADAALRATIAGLAAEGEPDPAPPVAARASRAADRGGWLARLLPVAPLPRFAAAFAALAVVALAALLLGRGPANEPLRDATPGAGAAFTVAEPRAIAGGVELAWTAVPGADRYRVVFLDAALDPVARADAGAATRLVLRADALPAGLAHGAAVGWQVEALAGNDLRATSPARALLVP